MQGYIFSKILWLPGEKLKLSIRGKSEKKVEKEQGEKKKERILFILIMFDTHL